MTRAHMHARVHVCITCTRTGIAHMHEREQASKHVHKTVHTCVCMQFWEQTSERVDTRLGQNVCDSQNTLAHARTCLHARAQMNGAMFRSVMCCYRFSNLIVYMSNLKPRSNPHPEPWRAACDSNTYA